MFQIDDGFSFDLIGVSFVVHYIVDVSPTLTNVCEHRLVFLGRCWDGLIALCVALESLCDYHVLLDLTALLEASATSPRQSLGRVIKELEQLHIVNLVNGLLGVRLSFELPFVFQGLHLVTNGCILTSLLTLYH